MAGIDRRSSEQRGLEIIAEFSNAVANCWERASLFRGHANAAWTPKASVFRDNVHGIMKPRDLTQWKAMAQRFVNPKPADDLEYLVLAQHYGVPTALLDWTSNPLMALFFASQQDTVKSTGQVIQTSRGHFSFAEYTLMVSPFATERDKPLLFDTSAMNTRSTAQDSFMSLHLPNEEEISVTSIFEISHENKYLVRSALSLFGLSTERVYVEISIAAERFKEEMELNWILGFAE